MTQIFLLKGAYHGENRTWPDPGNWNPVNTIECVGAGGYGYNGEPWDGMQGGSGHGGGGGAYAKGTNMTPTWPAKYVVAHSVQAPSSGADSTIFNSHEWSNSSIVPAGTVKASIGQPATIGGGRYGGAGGYVFGPTGFGGGKGGDGTYTPWSPLAADKDEPTPRPATYDNGAGGGGCGGPNGAGSNGANGSAAAAGVGGAADGGTVAGGGICQQGKSGTHWDASHGIGSGGGGAMLDGNSGRGGNYGGGGGGGAAVSTFFKNGSLGGDSMIILTYVPFVAAAPDTRAIFMV